jgi:hypothetical protein
MLAARSAPLISHRYRFSGGIVRIAAGKTAAGALDNQLGAERVYAAALTSVPPISPGRSFSFGNPSFIRSFVS